MNPNVYVDLPIDILRHIASFLPPSLNVCLTCKLFRDEVIKGRGDSSILTNLYQSDIDLVWLWNEIRSHESIAHNADTFTVSILCNHVVHSASKRNHLSFFTNPTVESTIPSICYYLVATNAYKINSIDLLEWVFAQGHDVRKDRYLTFYGAYYGHTDLILWALRQGSSMTWCSQTTLIAARNGHFDILRVMVEDESRTGICTWSWHPNTMPNAMKTCTDDEIFWLMDRGCPWDPSLLAFAAEYGSFEFIRRCHDERRIELPQCLPYKILIGYWEDRHHSSVSGHNSHSRRQLGLVSRDEKISMFRWVINHGCPFRVPTIDPNSNPLWTSIALVNFGDMDLLQWAASKGCIFTGCDANEKNMCLYTAIENGYLDIMYWLITSQGCSWDEHCPLIIAKSRNTSTLRLAIECGCPWGDVNMYTLMIYFGIQTNLLEWALQNKCSWSHMVTIYIVERNNLELMHWALRNGCPSSSMASTLAWYKGYMDIYNLLVSHDVRSIQD